jgi:hypothetical protein
MAQRRLELSGIKAPSSNTGSRSGRSSAHASRSPSRSRLGSRLPSDDEDDYTSNAFLTPKKPADQITEALDALLLQDALTTAKEQKDKFADYEELLNSDRRNTSLEAREHALMTIITIISQKYEPERINMALFGTLTKAFMTSRSGLESLLALQAICIAFAVDLDEGLDHAKTVSDKLFPQLSDDKLSVNIRANLTFGYSLLQFIINYGGGGFKVDGVIESLVDLAGGCNVDESTIAAAAIMGVGLLTTTVPSPNNMIVDVLAVLIDFLNSGATEIRLAAGKVIGLYYQIYLYDEDSNLGDFGDDSDDDTIPFIDHEELLVKLREIVAESSKKLSKKNKREQKSLFRDVISTVETFSSSETRNNLTSEDLTITHVNLSKGKSLLIDSWSKLILTQHYKWAYGPGIHTQIANNPFIKETIQEASIVLRDSYYQSDDVVSAPPTPVYKQKEDDKRNIGRLQEERQRARIMERREKQISQGTLAV